MLRSLLANWERFLHDDTDLDPLVRMAVGRCQFEAIHPFTDGNGRTGRVLNSLFFIEQQLPAFAILYLSRYIIPNEIDYYRLLLAVTRSQDWEPWVIFVLNGVEITTARWTVAKIDAIRGVRLHATEYVRTTLPKIYSHELVNLIFEQPYCRILNVTQRHIAHRQTAFVYLKELVQVRHPAGETHRTRKTIHSPATHAPAHPRLQPVRALLLNT